MNFELIEKNNALLKNLSEDNKKYCGKLLTYIRTAGLFYDEAEVEELLSQILQDIILAQENGESAEIYFGEKPQVAADELIQNLGKASLKKSFNKVGGILGGSLILLLLTMLSSPEDGINLILLILFALLGFLFIVLFFLFIHKGIYKKFFDKTIVSFLTGALFALPFLGLAYAIFFIVPDQLSFFTINVSDSVGIFLISVLLIGQTLLAIRNKNKINVLLPLLPMAWITGGLGILLRLPYGEIWMEENELIILILLFSGFAFFYIFAIVALLKIMKRQKKLRGDE